MMKERILITALCLALLPVGIAQAQGASKIRRNGDHLRIDKARIAAPSASRALATATSRSSLRAPRPISRSGGSLQAPRGNGMPGISSGRHRGLSGLNTGRSNGLSGLNGRTLGNGNALGGLLQQYLYNEYGGGHRYDPYAGEKAHAKAYRDAAIANAVVNVVGILATAQQQRQYGACPTQTVSAPRGHVERQRVLVQEGRTEEYQVWIPQHTIPETGEVVVGHHETRRRDIAPVYEVREVWVPAP